MGAPLFTDDLETVGPNGTVHNDPFRNANAFNVANGSVVAQPDNMVTNGSAENAGTVQAVHNDPLANLNALVLASGGAGALASNILTLGNGTGYTFGHPDWDDGTLTIRFKHVTSSGFGLHWHCTGSRGALLGAQANDVGCYVDGANLFLGKRIAGTWQSVVSTAIALVNGTTYWLRISSTGQTYTTTLYADNAGAMGGQLATTNSVYADAVLTTGWAGLRDYAGTAGIQVGGAFANVLRLTVQVPAGWVFNQGVGDVASGAWSTASAYNGARTLSIYYPTNQNSQANWQATTAPAVNGTNYTVRARIKGPSAFTGNSGWYFSDPSNANGPMVFTTAWTQSTFVFTPTGNGLLYLRADGGGGLAGAYYWDQVALYPTAAANNQLDMGGFTNAWFGHPDWTDGTLAVRFQSNGDQLAQVHQASPALIWHSQSRSNYNDCYIAFWNTSYDSHLTLNRYIGGAQAQLATSGAALGGGGGGWYWLEVSTVSGVITCTLYADNAGAKGAVLLTCTATDNTWPSGVAGLMNGWSGNLVWGGNYANVCTVTAPVPNTAGVGAWAPYSSVTADVCSLAWSAVSPFSGAKSLSIYVPTTNAEGFWQLAMPLLIKNQWYLVQAEAKGPAGNASALLETFDLTDVPTWDFALGVVPLSGSYQAVEMLFPTPSVGVGTMALRLRVGPGAAAGLYYFDRVQLAPYDDWLLVRGRAPQLSLTVRTLQ